MNDSEIKNVSASDVSKEETKKIDIEPIKSIVKDKTSKKLSKGLQKKTKKPSWWVRYSRKKLVFKLKVALKELGVSKAWAHKHFINAEEKKVNNITIYIELNKTKANKYDAHQIDALMDKKFKRKVINDIDVASLQPAIKELVSKDITPLL